MPELFKKVPGWFDFDDVYGMLVNNIHSGDVVEVGCWLGRSTLYLAESILESKKDINVYAVDTWKGSDEDAHKSYISEIGGPDKLYEEFLKNISLLPKKIVCPIRKPSIDASFLFENRSLSAVFIDADHRYEYIRRDILAWLPKIKPGGFIGGHDYTKEWNGVVGAVDEIFGDKKEIYRNSWLIRIKE